MAKMNDLSIQGVTDLHSYGVGFETGQEYERATILEAIRSILHNSEVDTRLVLGLLTAVDIVDGNPLTLPSAK